MLLSGEVTQELEVSDALPCGLICKDIVDAGGPRAARDPIPVFTGGVRGRQVVGVAFRHVGPAVLEEMHKDRVAPNVHIGIHAQEIGGIANACGRRGGIAEKFRAICVGVRI